MADLNLSVNENPFPLHTTENISALVKTTPSTLAEYLISGETIFPSGYDIAAVAGDGVTMRERSLSDNWVGLQSVNNFTASGLVIPGSSASLSIIIPLGVAYLAGRYVSVPATTVTVSPSTTSSIFLKVTRDAGLNVTGAYYEVNTTGTPPIDATPIATATAGVGTITSTTDERLLGPGGIIAITSGVTWIVKAGLTRIYVETIGASGGGGGGAGQGTGAGAGGAGGTGGTTTFDVLTTSGGGGGPGGGISGVGAAGALPGVGSGGKLSISGRGQAGGKGGICAPGTSTNGGDGGDGGYASSAMNVTPGASLTVAIGAAGTAGGAGAGTTAGGAGRAGQAGLIVVHY